MDDKNRRIVWPYAQLTRLDDEQISIREQIKPSCVTFIDVLGFKDMVYNDVDAVIFALRLIRMFCDSFFRLSKRDKSSDVHTLEFLPMYDASLDDSEVDEGELEKPYATIFSDSIVISKTIDNSFDLSGYIEFISIIQYTLLTNGILIRGGISLGNLYHSDGFIFGEGMINAHHIESKISKYPRIVIDKEIVKREEQKLDERLNENFSRYIQAYGERIYLEPYMKIDYDYTYSSFIKMDSDGEYYIDYLSDNFESVSASAGIEYLEISIRLLTEFYESTYQTIKQILSDGLNNKDKNVQKKYEWLRKKYNHSIAIKINTYIGKFKNHDEESKFIGGWKKKLLVSDIK